MDLTAPVVVLFLVLGVVAGVVAGYAGIGGGIVMVPVLLEVFRRWGLPADGIVQAAMGTSLAAAVFSVASSTLRHARQGRVLWRLVPYLAPGCIVGGWGGARLAATLPGSTLQLSLAAVLLLAALRMLCEQARPEQAPRRARWWQGLLVGAAVGCAAGLSGLAGGFVLVPALALLLHVPGSWLAGTSSAVVVSSALAAALSYLTDRPPTPLGPGFTGYVALPLAGLLLAGAVPGAQLGGWLNRRTDPTLFRRSFAVLLLAVVVRLLTTR